MVSGLRCTALAVVFSFSNKSYFVCRPSCPMSESAASQPNYLACEGKNPQHWPTTLLPQLQQEA
jgi:hypothetical protein